MNLRSYFILLTLYKFKIYFYNIESLTNYKIMGNSQNSNVQNLQYNLIAKYSQQNIQQFDLPQYGGKVFVDKINKLVFVYVRISVDQSQEFQQLINQRKTFNHKNLAKLLHFQQIKYRGSFCSVSEKQYRLVYQLFVFSLYNEIENCCKMKRPIPQHQIIRIFEEVAHCLLYLHSHHTSHGDLKVKSIFMDKNRTVKLVDSFFLKKGKTSYEIVLEDSNSMSLLAPQQLQLLRFKIFDSMQNIEHKQMFMLGMCMIQATTILQGMKCYNLKQLKIRDQFFIYMMDQIQSCGYSFDLSNLIMSCVHKNPAKRFTLVKFIQAINLLKNHRRG